MNLKNIINNEFNTPLDQFEIRDYLILDAPILNNLHISLTNMVLYILISFFFIITIFGVLNKYPKFIFRA
jgi:hypothetical protein